MVVRDFRVRNLSIAAAVQGYVFMPFRVHFCGFCDVVLEA